MRTAIAAILLTIFLSACATMPKPEQMAEAEALLSKLRAKNQGLTGIKGIGTIRFRDKEKTPSSRVAWLCSQEGLLRIGVLTVAGQPAASIAYNGENLYFYSHLDGQFRKQSTQDPDLGKLLSVPIKGSDIVSLLMGRVPIVPHRAALVERKPGEGDVLILKNSWGKVVEKVHLDASRNHVGQIEIFDGSSKYRAELSDQKDADSFRLPFALKVSGKDAEFSLSVDRYWTNMPLAPDMFVLLPPE